MLTDAYIEAAKDDNREPVTLISIESADGVSIDYSSQSDWENSVTLDEVDTAEVAGDAVHKANINTHILGINGNIFSWLEFTVVADSHITEISGRAAWLKIIGDPATISLAIQDTNDSLPTVMHTSESKLLTSEGEFSDGGSDWYYAYTSFTFRSAPKLIAGGKWYARQLGGLGGGFVYSGGITFNGVNESVKYAIPTAQLITSTLAFDVTPTTSPIFSVDDVKESGASIAYSVFGGNIDPPTNDLGTVVDGDALAPYKVYRITADFATTTGGRGRIRGFNLNEGIFRFYGSHRGLPFAAVQSVLPPKAVASVSQKIDPKKGVASTGQVSFSLLATAETEDMLATGYLAGKDVQVLSGFKSLSSVDDFRSIMVGTWQDYDLDDKKGIISVKLRDMLKQFQNRKLPEETYNSSTGSKTSTDIVYTNANVVAVIKDQFDRMGIRGRYLHPDYDTLEAGALSSADFNLTRTLSDPKDADKLLDELAQTAGLFLVPLGDGRLTPKLQDPSAPTTLTLDVRNYKAGQVKGNQKELLTRFITKYNAAVADPSGDEDYPAGYLFTNDVAEDLYDPEKGLRVWFDQWKVGSVSGADLSAPPQALIDWCDRQSAWFSEPRFSFPLSGIPPYIDIEAGDVIGIDGLRLPIPLAVYDAGTTYVIGVKVIYSGRVYRSKIDSNTGNQPDTSPTQWRDENLFDTGLTDNKPFLITAFKFDPNDAMSSVELREQVEE